jgi:hypothetical protein
MKRCLPGLPLDPPGFRRVHPELLSVPLERRVRQPVSDRAGGDPHGRSHFDLCLQFYEIQPCSLPLPRFEGERKVDVSSFSVTALKIRGSSCVLEGLVLYPPLSDLTGRKPQNAVDPARAYALCEQPRCLTLFGRYLPRPVHRFPAVRVNERSLSLGHGLKLRSLDGCGVPVPRVRFRSFHFDHLACSGQLRVVWLRSLRSDPRSRVPMTRPTASTPGDLAEGSSDRGAIHRGVGEGGPHCIQATDGERRYQRSKPPQPRAFPQGHHRSAASIQRTLGIPPRAAVPCPPNGSAPPSLSPFYVHLKYRPAGPQTRDDRAHRRSTTVEKSWWLKPTCRTRATRL